MKASVLPRTVDVLELPAAQDSGVPSLQIAMTLAEVSRYLSLHPRTVVEVGCGEGRRLAHYKRLRASAGYRDSLYEGWDTHDAVRGARNLEGDGLRFVRADLLSSERTADLVLCVHRMFTDPGDQGFLRSLRRHGSAFLFLVPLYRAEQDSLGFRGRTGLRGVPVHRWAVDRDLARAALKSAGYRVEYERYVRAVDVQRPSDSLRERVRTRLLRFRPHTVARWLGGYELVIFATPR